MQHATCETLQEYTDARAVRLHVDRAQSTIRGVKILGLRSRNGRIYLPAALAAAVELYEGARVNINHPKGHPHTPRDYQDRIGTLRSVALRDGEGLFGDLHLNPAHALAEQLLWDAEHAPDNVGLSHNVQAQTVRRGDATIVEAILKVQGVDLVADPATTRGLFEAVAPVTASRADATDAELILATEATHSGGRDHQAPGSSAKPTAAWTLEQAQQALGQLQTERETLSAELRQLRAQVARHERYTTVRRLLTEQGLPDPDLRDAVSQGVVGAVFVEELLSAESESAMRALIGERARLVAAARSFGIDHSRADLPAAGRPRSREQQMATPRENVTNARDFVRAIT